MAYGSIAEAEATSLLGGREDNNGAFAKNRSENTGLARLRLLGSFLVFFAAASIVLVNHGHNTTGMTTAGAGLESSLSSLVPEGVVHYVNGGFSKGAGHPIFVIEGSQSCEPHNFQSILAKAEEKGAYIIAGEHGTAVLEAVESIRNELECHPDKTNPDYCLVLTFDCIGDTTILSVKILDDEKNLQKIDQVDTADGNSVIEISDIIGDATEAFDLLAAADISDGPLQPPYLLEPVEEASRDGCGGATWTDPKTKVYHITLEVADHATKAALTFTTRTMNGRFFGPLLRVKRGETVRIFFDNKLEDSPPKVPYRTAPCNNAMCQPNHSNLHYHGGHVSGEEPSDDVELSIRPGECYNYETHFPENHMPGTHWIHPHYHGSSTIQVGGGAAMPMIVEDDPETFPIPPEVETANDVLLFVQSVRPQRIQRSISIAYFGHPEANAADSFDYEASEGVPDNYRLVNGQYRPSLKIKTGAWNRFRVVYAGWDDSRKNLDWKIDSPGCEQYLLAKDGIYIKDYPRKLDYFPVPAGGRADIMVRCNFPGKFEVTNTYYDIANADEVLMTIEAKGPPIANPEPLTENFEWQFPPYLEDVIDEPILMGDEGNCSCTTDMDYDFFQDGFLGVNKRAFKEHTAVHTVEQGQIAERKLLGMADHPYHQHVYPFQLTGGFDPGDKQSTMDGYFLNGDWHDNIRVPGHEKDMYIRYKAGVHKGKVMLHCHRLFHEDFGMMSQELVSPDVKCQCNAWVVTK